MAITSPANNETVSAGDVVIRGTAADTGGSGVLRVDLKVDNGAYFQASNTSGNWSTWTITRPITATGSHILKARATDNAVPPNYQWTGERTINEKFLAKVSKMGEKIVIVVPMDYHNKVKPFLGKRVKLEMDDEVL